MAPFRRLVRFKDETGSVFYGELGDTDEKLTKEYLTGRNVQVYRGQHPWTDDFALTEERKTTKEILSPLASTPIFMCVGLNYRKHADEVKIPHPMYPSIFMKPPSALAGPFDDIPVPSICENIDYEAEICFIISKDCKNVADSEDVSQYILGYTIGNDVSSRDWQGPERSGSASRAKSFDKFAPIGPCLISSDFVSDPSRLSLQTFVNGELRQTGRADDMIFDIPSIVRWISKGMTIRAGTVVMTGTPAGVAAFMKPPAWLQSGDVVEIHMDHVGVLKNRIVKEQI